MRAKKDKPADSTADLQHKQVRGRPFQPGQSGNPAGRPQGSKNRLQEDFLSALADDFAAHGKAALVSMREERPSEYIRVVASLMPKDANINVGGEAFSQFWQMVASGQYVVTRGEAADDDERYGDLLN